MLHILLLILKITGIVLAVLLGIVLLLLAALLFVPIRYTVYGKYNEKPTLRLKAHWLLHCIRASVLYDDKLDIKVKALFFTLYSSDKSEDKEEKPKKAKKAKTEKEPEKKEFEKKESEKEEREYTVFDELEQREAGAKTEIKQETASSAGKSEEDKTEINELVPKKSKLETIKEKIAGFVHRIREVFQGIMNKSISIKETVKEKVQKISEAVNDEENKELVRFLWEKIKKLLKLLKPKKYKIKARFGFESPDATGNAAMYLAVLYGLLGMDIELIPDFEEQVLEGEVYLKGGIRLFGILVIIIQVYFNKLVQEKLLKKSK